MYAQTYLEAGITFKFSIIWHVDILMENLCRGTGDSRSHLRRGTSLHQPVIANCKNTLHKFLFLNATNMFLSPILILSPLLFLLLASSTPIATATLPPKGTCTIQSVDVDVDTSGSGCRAGSVGVSVSQDNSIINIIFDNFQAAIGPNAGDISKRALCKVNVTMSSPGWAFDVNTVDFRGYLKLAAGVEVSLVSRWKWVNSKGVDLKGKVSLMFSRNEELR
jgi:hypothetical protein